MIGHNSAISAGHLRATILGWRAANPDVEIDGVEADRARCSRGSIRARSISRSWSAKRAMPDSGVRGCGTSVSWPRCRQIMPLPQARPFIGPICGASAFCCLPPIPARKSATCCSAA
jgi:hypothetical protein